MERLVNFNTRIVQRFNVYTGDKFGPDLDYWET